MSESSLEYDRRQTDARVARLENVLDEISKSLVQSVRSEEQARAYIIALQKDVERITVRLDSGSAEFDELRKLTADLKNAPEELKGLANSYMDLEIQLTKLSHLFKDVEELQSQNKTFDKSLQDHDTVVKQVKYVVIALFTGGLGLIFAVIQRMLEK